MTNGLRTYEWHDTHCHLDFAPQALDVARNAPWPMVSMTVDPRDYEPTRNSFSPFNNVHVAAGLHPWWIADGRCGRAEASLLAQLVETTSFVGEVGLDFSQRHEGSEDEQIWAFDLVIGESARIGGKIVSIHSLRSADTVLDVLERHGTCSSCACILHWFSGSSEQLHRAIEMGCYFSVNERMMATGRGREYAKVMPADHILFETDLPTRQGEPCSADDLLRSLQNTLEAVETACKRPCLDELARTSALLLGAVTR